MFKKLMIFSVIFSSLQAHPCSTVAYEGIDSSPWVIKSFDFSDGQGYAFINKRNIAKKSLTLSTGSGKSWVSKYGSVSFNQISRDFPYGGMNETGLNMEIMWLDSTRYPTTKKSSDQINESQLIQYIIDTAATTKEAVEKIEEVSLVAIMAPVHYMICDVSNECVTVEYLNEKLVVTPMEKGKEQILQNSIYRNTLKYDLRVSGRTPRNSTADINFIFNNKKAQTEEEFVNKSFANLDRLAQENWSRWQIVYNQQTKKIWFRTIKTPIIKSINMAEYELDCLIDPEEKIIDLDSPVSGEVRDHLITHTKEINKKMLDSFKHVPGWMRTLGNAYTSMNHKCVK